MTKMKKIERTRNREAARVLLIQARDMLTAAHTKLREIKYDSGIERKFEDIFDGSLCLLIHVTEEQDKEEK